MTPYNGRALQLGRHTPHVFALLGFVVPVACAVGADVTPDPNAVASPVKEAGAADGPSIKPATDGGPLEPSPEDASLADAKSDAVVDSGPIQNPACTTALAALKFDFDSGAQGFTHGPLDGKSGSSWPFDPWKQGTPTKALGCKSGACFATELTENYAQCQRGYVRSPVLDLSACAAEDLALAFDHAYTFWSANYQGNNYYDGGVVEISKDGGTTWVVAGPYTYPGTVTINPEMTSSYACLDNNNFHVDQLPGFVQTQTTWTRVSIPIVAAYRTAQFAVRFSFGSGVSSMTTSASSSRNATGPGWHIDDVAIERM